MIENIIKIKMKEKILKCENCKMDTRHLVGKKHSVQNGGRREIRHCCECGQRIIKNRRTGQHIKNYSNEKTNKELLS